VFVDDLTALQPGDDDARHLGRVLRLRPGEAVIAADGRGRWRPAAYAGAGPLEPTGPVVLDERPHPPVVVGFVPVKGERPEWVVQKLTEVGVDRIVVLRSARSVVRWNDARAAPVVDRLRRVAREAAAQSRRAWLPAVEGVLDLGALAALVAPGPLALAQPGASAPASATTAVAVGPEGGWDPAELAQVPRHVGLGPGILRAETAALGAGILLCALRDGLAGPAGGASG
jgi:16S rRNA (uracil1498-N3)-methyltransferase